ncbi:M56 family metallopeptidase [Butyribacter intestini]|jgi:beta-lactamase regulating signal transducer with metallopeptidase domain|uniref:M56 family metallopeptidase n=1 Tax=Butyribacter intestini TaxID=1703332 RepID=UPI0022E74656|nr:M56 family metallopeptidase [Butyribacter intestini]
MLKNIFVYLLHNSIAVCVVILTVFAVRLFLRRAPKKYSYILWAIVGIYLLCPIRLSSPISIYSLLNNVSDTFLEHHSLPLNAKNFADKNKTYNEKNQKTKDSNKSKFDNVSSTNKNQKTKQNQNNTAGTENISQSLTVTTTAYIWLCGCIVLLVRNLFLIWRTKQTVLMAIRRKDNIYESECISTPFVLGIVRPKIYIPFNLSEQEREYILKHEQYHIRRKDQIIKICAYILCVIYWFQPLIWFAYFVMIRDMEMSCDEYVLKNSKSDIRAAYSTSLLKLATKTEDFNAGLPAFGESDIRKRVKNIMKFNAKKKWVSVVAAIAVVIVGVSCLTKAAVKTDANKPNKIIAEKKIGPDNNKMTYGDKIDNNIKAADTSNNEKAINNIKDNSTADETDMDSDDIVPITKNIYSIDKINKSGNPLAVSILKKVRQVFPKEVYQEMMWHGKMYLAEFKQGDISCSITNKNKADNLYLDLYFNGDGTLESMLNQSTVRNVKKTDKNTEINKIVEFAKVFLNSDVIYTDNKNSKNNKKSSKAVMITEGKLPERYDSSGCLSAYKDNHGNAYLFNRNSGMVMSFYMDE